MKKRMRTPLCTGVDEPPNYIVKLKNKRIRTFNLVQTFQ